MLRHLTDIASTIVAVVAPDTTALQTAQRMHKHHVGVLGGVDAAARKRPIGIVTDRALHARARSGLRRWVDAGAIVQRETVTHGLVRVPRAFIAMPAGTGHGKHLVKVAPDWSGPGQHGVPSPQRRQPRLR